jgi:hypothetical protein
MPRSFGWAVDPASGVWERAGEEVLPKAAELSNENAFAEQSARGFGLPVTVFCGSQRFPPESLTALKPWLPRVDSLFLI